MSKKNKKDKHRDQASDPMAEQQEPASEEPTIADAAPSEAGENDEVTRLRVEVGEWKDKFLRAKAEQQNVARRAANELEESIRYANTGVLRALVDVADDLDRTLEAAGKSESVEAVVDGVRMVRDKLNSMLRNHHVEPIEAENQPFDPARHEALMQQPSAEHEPGTVVQQVQKGYTLRERVLRPAKVIVAAPPADEPPAE